jgi:hypothetical protein
VSPLEEACPGGAVFLAVWVLLGHFLISNIFLAFVVEGFKANDGLTEADEQVLVSTPETDCNGRFRVFVSTPETRNPEPETRNPKPGTLDGSLGDHGE